MGELDGVRVLVTGGTSGLGRAMAEAVAAAGANVVITGRHGQRTVAAAREIGASGGAATGIAADVRQPSSVAACADAVFERLGGLDVLVNNAGLGMRTVNPRFLTSPQPFWEVTPEGFADLMLVNVTGYFLMARAIVPRMVAAGRGKVVNIAISHATMRRAGFVPYGPSRAATESLSRIMAADCAGTGITVNMLLPGGATATGMIPAGIPAGTRAALLDPSVMAEPIRWLCSPASDGVHDERIVATEFADWLRGRTAP